MHIKSVFTGILGLLFYTSCHSVAKPGFLPAGYSWQTMQQVRLDEELNEISGLVWDEVHQVFLAEEDEDGILYVLDRNYQIKSRLRFAKKGDYEDIAIANGLVYLLRSDGKIYEMKFDGQAIGEVTKYDYPGETAEFETLLWDQPKGKLLLITKNSKLDKKTETTHAFAFDLQSKTFETEPVVSLTWAAISKMAGDGLSTFKPSAAAVNPITGEIYILASVEKLLVVYNRDWQLLKTCSLDPRTFLQPESMTFDSKGNLYIANEANERHPMLQYFPYKK